MRELIDVPVVQTVVRLADAASPSAREGMVREFVLTRQVERNLRALAASVDGQSGAGFFLVGPYGSGKSHFLSYVSLVLSGEARPLSSGSPGGQARPDGGSCPLANAIGERRLLPVRVSLVAVRGGSPLEDAVMEEAERALGAAGARTPLSRRSRFLDHVEHAIRPIDPAAMDAWLAARRLPPWEELRADRDRAAVAAWGFVKTLSGCPAEPKVPPDALIRDLIQAARGAGFDGVICVVDELSEFLRSKPTHAALSEDARYLQLLGEIARSEPLWIVASLQEAIEQAGDIARDVIGKIKDRYPVRLLLGEGHVRELIDGRLVRKLDGAREKIRDIWRRFTECLPMFQIDFEDFYRTYPVHPATISYLEGLSPLLSAHRGVVDFIVAQVRGDPKRGAPGLLGGPADRLLTADLIYTHFRDRIRGDDRYAPYDALVRADAQRAIQKVFPDEADRDLARRASDVLILGEISELEKPKTVSELAAILLAAVTEVSPEANDQYLAEVILAPLLKECLFLRCEPGEKVGDSVYRVSLERDSRGLFEKEREQVLAGVAAGDARIARAVFGAAPCQVPLGELIGGAKPPIAVPWRGTQRKGVLLWAESAGPAEAALSIERDDLDFAVVVVPPGFEPPAGESYPDRALMWVPRWEEEELSAMRRFYGALLLADEGRAGTPRAVRDEAARAVKDGAAGMGRAIEAGFRRGRFRCAGREMEAGQGQAAAAGFVERLSAAPVLEMLKGVHPRFLEIAPEVEFVSRRALSPLIDAILAPGRISMAQARKNNTRTMIEGVLIPMGLARAQGPSFVMQLDPARSLLVRDAMDAIGSGGTGVAELIGRLRRGPWGLVPELAGLLIVALVRGGLSELRKGGRRIPSAIVGFSHVEEADDICAGELLPASLRDRLLSDALLSQGIAPAEFSLASQREAWARLIQARDRLREHAAQTLPKLSAVSEYPVFDAFDFERVRGAIERGLDAVAVVDEAAGSSKGLEKYLLAQPPDLAAIVREADAAARFASEDAERIVRVADYVRDLPPEGAMPADVAEAAAEVRGMLARLTEIVLGEEAGGIAEAFDRLFEAYAAWYVEEHRRAFSRERFAPFERIRETDAWRALSAAEAISGIHLVDGARSASKRIDAALSLRCARSPSAELRLKPRCGCGFVPGVVQDLEDAGAIEAAVRAGVEEACRALSDGQVKERLVARAAALKDLDPKKAAELGAFLDRLRSGLSAEGFVSAMTPNLARLLSDALHRRVDVVARDVGALAGRLAGRRLPPPRIRQIFEEWLGDCRGEEVLVDLGGGAEGPSREALLMRWAADHGLDEERARMALLVPPEVKASPSLGQLDADDGMVGRMAEAAGLAQAPPEECLRSIARERICRPFAWEAAGALARHIADGWRPDDALALACAFDDVQAWCRAAAAATMAFEPGEPGALVLREASRDGALSFVVWHHRARGFPSPPVAGRLIEISRGEALRRDECFSTLPEWDVRFDDLAARFPGAAYLFVDAARWDLVPRFDRAVRAATGWGQIEERWRRVPEASTAGWQRAFFGTDDMEAIASMLLKRGVRYAGDCERAEAAVRLREREDTGPLWLRMGSLDRLLHASTSPLHRLMDEAAREFEEAVMALAGVIKARGALVLLTDHGFSESSREEGNAGRFGHGAANPQDAVAVMAAYGEAAR